MPVYAGWNIKARIASNLDGLTGSSLTGTSLDGVVKVTTEYGTGMSPVGQVGQRYSYAHIPGKITISASINRYYTGSGIKDYFRGTNEIGSVTATPNFGIYPNGEVSGQPYIVIQNSDITNYRNSFSPGGSLMNEVVDVIGIREWTGSLP